MNFIFYQRIVNCTFTNSEITGLKSHLEHLSYKLIFTLRTLLDRYSKFIGLLDQNSCLERQKGFGSYVSPKIHQFASLDRLSNGCFGYINVNVNLMKIHCLEAFNSGGAGMTAEISGAKVQFEIVCCLIVENPYCVILASLKGVRCWLTFVFEVEIASLKDSMIERLLAKSSHADRLVILFTSFKVLTVAFKFLKVILAGCQRCSSLLYKFLTSDF